VIRRLDASTGRRPGPRRPAERKCGQSAPVNPGCGGARPSTHDRADGRVIHPRFAKFLLESGGAVPALARRLAESFDTHVPSRAYRVDEVSSPGQQPGPARHRHLRDWTLAAAALIRHAPCEGER
jgi:hypothetical protein